MLTFRDFDFLRMIGSGTFGKVFLAKLVNKEKYFAIKRMDKQYLIESRQLDNIYNEAKILRETYRCPFIVNFLHFIDSDTDVFLIMEYIKGGELFYYLKKYGRFPDAAITFYACEILMALKYLHERNIVYRDLKPENVLINCDGHVKLADFGFASRTDDNVFLICGTPEYMAPEKLLGNGDSKDTDYWSYGCIVYEMIYGRPPFYGSNSDIVYNRVIREPIVIPDGVNPVFRDFVSRLLTRERHNRLGFSGISDILAHPFFGDVDWEKVNKLQLVPPFAAVLNQFEDEDASPPPVPVVKKPTGRPSYTYKRTFKIE